jgi:hypothetical protein
VRFKRICRRRERARQGVLEGHDHFRGEDGEDVWVVLGYTHALVSVFDFIVRQLEQSA